MIIHRLRSTSHAGKIRPDIQIRIHGGDRLYRWIRYLGSNEVVPNRNQVDRGESGRGTLLPTARTWAARALHDLDIEVIVVTLPDTVRNGILDAQRRQYR